jgi:hypothetical protein
VIQRPTETGNNILVTLSTDTEEFFDLTYSNEPASYYYLILEVKIHSVKAAWYHSTKNLITGFASYPFDGSFRRLLESYPFLASEFKEVLVCVESSNYLLAPKNIIDGANPEIFQLSNALDKDSEALRTTDLVNLKSEVVHPISMDLESEITSSFKHVKIISHIAPRIEHELNTLRSVQSQTAIYAHIAPESLDVRVYLENKLSLANAYYQTGKEDIAYYLLYASEVMDVNPEKTNLVLSGGINIGDEVWVLLSKYWKNIALVEPLSRIEISDKLSGDKAIPYHHLTHALLCAS